MALLRGFDTGHDIRMRGRFVTPRRFTQIEQTQDFFIAIFAHECQNFIIAGFFKPDGAVDQRLLSPAPFQKKRG